MATSERQADSVKPDITLAQVRIIKWPSRRNYWTVMVGRVTYGQIFEHMFYMDSQSLKLIGNKDRQTITQAANNHIEMLKVTKRLLS